MKVKRKIMTISGINAHQLSTIKKHYGCVSDSETIRSIIQRTFEGISK